MSIKIKIFQTLIDVDFGGDLEDFLRDNLIQQKESIELEMSRLQEKKEKIEAALKLLPEFQHFN